MNELELRHLRHLAEVRTRAYQYASVYDTEIEDFVLELREDGCSTRSIAEALGVGTSTVQGWVSKATARRRQASG